MAAGEIIVLDGLTEEIRRATEMVCCAFVIIATTAKSFVGLEWIGLEIK